jgi:hypothetical protein
MNNETSGPSDAPMPPGDAAAKPDVEMHTADITLMRGDPSPQSKSCAKQAKSPKKSNNRHGACRRGIT